MQLDLPFLRSAPEPAVEFVRVRRARKYILRIRPDGSLRVTIPRGGSRREAEAFVASHKGWTDRERVRLASVHAAVAWHAGDVIPLRGEPAALRVERDARGPLVILERERVRLKQDTGDLRAAAETALRRIAERELVPRLQELAAAHGLRVARAVVKNQRSRWGSCSREGSIALNFRLVQMPRWVCDYVLLHELMHLREQNHSRRYWRLVEQVCPEFRDAERWLRAEGRSLF